MTGESKSDRDVELLIHEMQGLCSQVETIGLEQQAHLDNDNIDAFVDRLVARGPVVDALVEISAKVESTIVKSSVSQACTDHAREELAKMGARIDAVLERDTRQQHTVEARKRELSKQLSGVGQSRGALKAYQGNGQHNPPTLTNKEG